MDLRRLTYVAEDGITLGVNVKRILKARQSKEKALMQHRNSRGSWKEDNMPSEELLRKKPYPNLAPGWLQRDITDRLDRSFVSTSNILTFFL